MKSVCNSLVMLTVCVAAVADVRPAVAGASEKLFSLRTAATEVTLPTNATGTGWVTGVLNAGALDAPALEIPLPDGQVLIALQTHVSSDSRLDIRTWTGHIVGAPGDFVSLARRRSTTAGFLNSAGRTFEILPGNSSQHVLFEVISQRTPMCDAVPAPGFQTERKTQFGNSVVGGVSAAMNPVVHDLLVLYTPASDAVRSPSVLESMIVAAVEAANESYRRSNVNITLSLVGLQMVGMTEGSSMPQTLAALSCDPSCSAIRNDLGADIVLFVTEQEDKDLCGYAYIMDADSTSFAPFACALVRSHCLSSQTLTHEIGHVQGVAHDRETGGSPGAFPYAHGYRRCVRDGVAFHDIMAYRCTDMPSEALLTFASPDIYYHGYQTGISYELDPANSADAVRTLNETGPTVASFRATGMSVPSQPASLTATMNSTGNVNLAWTDRADDEAGFTVERTTDGANYVETARLSANVIRYQDLTTNSMTVYSYRVAAYNSAGHSPYSNVATVKPASTDGGGDGHGGSGGGKADVWLICAASLLAVMRRSRVVPRRRLIWVGSHDRA